MASILIFCPPTVSNVVSCSQRAAHRLHWQSFSSKTFKAEHFNGLPWGCKGGLLRYSNFSSAYGPVAWSTSLLKWNCFCFAILSRARAPPSLLGQGSLTTYRPEGFKIAATTSGRQDIRWPVGCAAATHVHQAAKRGPTTGLQAAARATCQQYCAACKGNRPKRSTKSASENCCKKAPSTPLARNRSLRWLAACIPKRQLFACLRLPNRFLT